ncbi:MAG: PTS lactose/cellobiose transporter subunit IIA [Intestinibacter bartlettii]
MAMESISLAKEAKFEEAKELLAEARAEVNKAHKHFQTNLIQAQKQMVQKMKFQFY